MAARNSRSLTCSPQRAAGGVVDMPRVETEHAKRRGIADGGEALIILCRVIDGVTLAVCHHRFCHTVIVRNKTWAVRAGIAQAGLLQLRDDEAAMPGVPLRPC